jgi:hypothetical protein
VAIVRNAKKTADLVVSLELKKGEVKRDIDAKIGEHLE